MAYRCKRPTEITFDIGNGQLRSRDFSSAGCVDIHSRFSILRMQSTARTKDNARCANDHLERDESHQRLRRRCDDKSHRLRKTIPRTEEEGLVLMTSS